LIVLDTHALVWWATDASALSARARRAIQTAARRGPAVASTISLFGIATAVRRERLRLSVTLEQWLTDLRMLPDLHLEPVTAAIAQLAGSLDSSFPGDPADRIIVATAIELKGTLVTADARLRQSHRVETVW
jgi:PIN domain nuclease of toxin-antitoxin system